jgi:hypothetical protein
MVNNRMIPKLDMAKLAANNLREERVMNYQRFVNEDAFDTPQAHMRSPSLELAPKVHPTVAVSQNSPNPGLDMLVANLNMSSSTEN